MNTIYKVALIVSVLMNAAIILLMLSNNKKVEEYNSRIFNQNDSLKREIIKIDKTINESYVAIDSIYKDKTIINKYYETNIKNIFDGTISDDSVTSYIRSRIYRYDQSKLY